MVQRVHVVLEDDIDGSSADQTVHFGWKGVEYEIDLSAAHVEEFTEAMEPWLKNARRSSASRTRGKRRAAKSSSASGLNPAEVRAWARAQGMQVNDRGRVPASVLEAYREAH